MPNLQDISFYSSFIKEQKGLLLGFIESEIIFLQSMADFQYWQQVCSRRYGEQNMKLIFPAPGEKLIKSLLYTAAVSWPCHLPATIHYHTSKK